MLNCRDFCLVAFDAGAFDAGAFDAGAFCCGDLSREVFELVALSQWNLYWPVGRQPTGDLPASFVDWPAPFKSQPALTNALLISSLY